MIIDHSWSAACAAFWNPAGQQALLTVAHLRKGETYADLACGFQIGTSTVYRYLREALELLAALAPALAEAIDVARGKAFVILDGTLLPIDRVGICNAKFAAELRHHSKGSSRQAIRRCSLKRTGVCRLLFR